MEEYTKKQLKTKRQKQKKSIKSAVYNTIWVLLIGASLYGVFWVVTLPKIPQIKVVSENGIHSHSTLSIEINGKKINIPSNVGISAISHSPMHTHEGNGVIHMEYGGVVREKDLDLSKFFNIWGEDFNSTSFMGNPVGKKGELKMTVNGKDNLEFEKYSMKDGDVIDITYKSL